MDVTFPANKPGKNLIMKCAENETKNTVHESEFKPLFRNTLQCSGES
jgi:hypothetical protein